jgi:hypothetical protein
VVVLGIFFPSSVNIFLKIITIVKELSFNFLETLHYFKILSVNFFSKRRAFHPKNNELKVHYMYLEY